MVATRVSMNLANFWKLPAWCKLTMILSDGIMFNFRRGRGSPLCLAPCRSVSRLAARVCFAFVWFRLLTMLIYCPMSANKYKFTCCFHGLTVVDVLCMVFTFDPRTLICPEKDIISIKTCARLGLV
jgi:hypothetical protein